ncbi:MAG: endonuclease domain-containing protein, partial [Rhizobiales bacterium]|nr:endonuclease domain-containing protein [Hyphomicrobiales bacterium]
MPAPGTEELSAAKSSRARALRESMTDAEQKLWRLLRDRRLEGSKFRRQVPVGPYIADFLSFQHRLVVEADGGQHAESARDAVRDAYFAANGFRVLRFWNNDILVQTESVLEAIYQALLATPHPRPLSRQGRGEAKRGHPSPLAGEGGSRRSRETGEGA